MKVLLLMMSIMLLYSIEGYSQAQKNIVKSYKYNGESTILLAVDGPVEVEEWDEKLVRLVTTIDAVNFNEGTLKALADAGRYTCASKGDGGSMVLTMLKAQRDLELRGVKIEEKYTFKIFVPRGVTLEQVEHKDVAAMF